MGVITYDMEVPTSIPPAKLFKAFVLDADHLIPTIMPSAVKSVEVLEGDGGAGTIKLTTFGEGSTHKYEKKRVDSIDKENFTFRYSVIERDALGDAIESISYEVKICTSADGCSIYKNHRKCITKGDATINKEHIKRGKEKASAIFKAIESFILAKPDTC